MRILSRFPERFSKEDSIRFTTCLISVTRQENPRSMTAGSRCKDTWKLLPCRALPYRTSPPGLSGRRSRQICLADGAHRPRFTAVIGIEITRKATCPDEKHCFLSRSVLRLFSARSGFLAACPLPPSGSGVVGTRCGSPEMPPAGNIPARVALRISRRRGCRPRRDSPRPASVRHCSLVFVTFSLHLPRPFCVTLSRSCLGLCSLVQAVAAT